MGRLFDAVAALLGICPRASFDGEAPMRLEALAAGGCESAYPVTLDAHVVRVAPLVAALVADLERGVSPARIAARFHGWVVELIVTASRELAGRHRLSRVALSGGVFVNRIVSAHATARLAGAGLEVLCHRLVPPNDGGLALGQLAVAAAQDGGQA
jgi:hydrogenase maturation protein HypF